MFAAVEYNTYIIMEDFKISVDILFQTLKQDIMIVSMNFRSYISLILQFNKE